MMMMFVLMMLEKSADPHGDVRPNLLATPPRPS